MTDKTIIRHAEVQQTQQPGPSSKSNVREASVKVKPLKLQGALNLDKLASIYDEIGPLQSPDVGKLDSKRCLWAIFKCLSKMPDTQKWSDMFSKEKWTDPKVRQYFELIYFRKPEKALRQLKTISNIKGKIRAERLGKFLHQALDLRLNWFFKEKYASLTAACLIKFFEVKKKDHKDFLSESIYKMAKPVLNADRKFWNQRLILPPLFELVCPHALFEAKIIDGKEIHSRNLRDPSPYFSETKDEMVAEKHPLNATSSRSGAKTKPLKRRLKHISKRHLPNSGSDSSDSSEQERLSLTSSARPQAVQKHFDTESLIPKEHNGKTFKSRYKRLKQMPKSETLTNAVKSSDSDHDTLPASSTNNTGTIPNTALTFEIFNDCLRCDVAALSDKLAKNVLQLERCKTEHEKSRKRLEELSIFKEKHDTVSSEFQRLVNMLGDDRARASFLFLRLKKLIIEYACNQNYDIESQFKSIFNEQPLVLDETYFRSLSGPEV